jgi:hypothetical protein
MLDGIAATPHRMLVDLRLRQFKQSAITPIQGAAA